MSGSETSRTIPKGEWSVTSFGSTALSAHWSLALAIVGVAVAVRLWLQRFSAEMDTTVALVATFVVVSTVLFSLIGRELLQVQVAKHHGVGIPLLSLSALGGRVRATSIPPHPRAQFQISSAGLLFTFVLAACLFALSTLGRLFGIDESFLRLASLLGWLNLVLALANLTPTSPLDGGRIITAILWHRKSSRSLGQRATGRVSLVAGVTLILSGLAVTTFGYLRGSVFIGLGVVLAGLGIFAFVMGRSQVRHATIRHRLETTPLATVMASNPEPVPDWLTVQQLQNWAKPARADVALPVTRWDAEAIGFVVPNIGRELSAPERSWTTIAKVMHSRLSVPRAWSSETVAEILRRVDLQPGLVVVVHDPEPPVEVGTITFEQLRPLFSPPDFWGRAREPKNE